MSLLFCVFMRCLSLTAILGSWEVRCPATCDWVAVLCDDDFLPAGKLPPGASRGGTIFSGLSAAFLLSSSEESLYRIL
jgi:hypothetical protein